MVIRIGFKLTQAIPQEIYDTFSFVDSKPKFVDQRFFKDQLFRDVVNANMQKVVRSFQEKPKLKNIFEALEVKREENRYLKNHIELLCEVTCQVGKDIGWISEKNLEKMVYISYLHDVRYFAKPSLAKIRDKKEFELRKAILSEEERKLFMEGPEYSAALAKDDDSSFPDAHKILLQHRERPNGRGFPHGEKASALAPLSCLFMVCHEFVDYLIADEEWSYEEFVSRNRHSYVGPYFNKIFQVFEDLK